MYGLVFEHQAAVVTSAPNRADIACFVGFVGRRSTPIPAEIRAWLHERGWDTPPYQRAEPIESLLDLPVPIDTWEAFDQLFAWDQRPLDQPEQRGTTYLGAAVRSFFAQGGRKCYVVRGGDPWPVTLPRDQRLARLSALIPGYPTGFDGSPLDRESWHGVGHLFGLPDVSLVCLPDLADAVGADRRAITPPPPMPEPEEQFVECSRPEAAAPPSLTALRFRAPRCSESGYSDWARAVWIIADLLRSPRQAIHLREMQLVAAVPLPEPETPAAQDLLGFLAGFLATNVANERDGLASAFVQLVYPWVGTPGGANLPEGLESPDAVVAGVLARSALTRGAFRSAARQPLADVSVVEPVLRRDQMLQPHPDTRFGTTEHRLRERVTLLGPTPNGLRLLSDVTTSLDESYRPASVNRLVAVIVRAARRLGEDVVFEASGELLWARLRDSLNGLLGGLLQAGALRGATPGEAFQVRCDRSTMSQSDIDNGRIIAEIRFDAAAPIEQITVVLAMNEGGNVSLVMPAQGAV